MPEPKEPNPFWEQVQEMQENNERRLLNDIESALSDHPKAVADLLRGWVRSDKKETRS